MRHFPYGFTRWALRHIQKEKPAIVYLHPYEIDTRSKQFDIVHLSPEDQKKAIKHHKMQLRNRNTVRVKIVRLLSEFEFAPIGEVIAKCGNVSYCPVDGAG